MAKKAKAEIASAPCGPGEYKPTLYLDFQGKDASQLVGVAVGDEVEIVVRGKVKGVSQRQRTDYDDDKKIVKTGTIDLEDYKVQIMEEEKNEFVELSKDD